MPPTRRVQVRQTLAAAGLPVVAVDSSIRLTGDDPGPDLRRFLQLASDWDAPLVRVFGGDLDPPPARQDRLRAAARVLEQAVPLAARLGVHLRIATPANYAPAADVLADAKRAAKETRAKIELFSDPKEAVAGAQAVYTDSWTSMGFEAEEKVRRTVFAPYQVNGKLMEQAAEKAVFMHCLPAHRGAEVTNEILDGPSSIVLEQSENRMYVQKAILHALYT